MAPAPIRVGISIAETAVSPQSIFYTSTDPLVTGIRASTISAMPTTLLKQARDRLLRERVQAAPVTPDYEDPRRVKIHRIRRHIEEMMIHADGDNEREFIFHLNQAALALDNAERIIKK